MRVRFCTKTVAEGEGFEPPVGLHPQRFSRPPRSTTPPTLQNADIISKSAGDGLAETRERDQEEDESDQEDREERLPHDLDADAAVEDIAREGVEVRRRQERSEVADERGHALERRRAAGQHVHWHQHEDHEHAELRHAARDRRKEDPERVDGEEDDRHTDEEERDRSRDRDLQPVPDDKEDRPCHRQQHHERHRPDLRGHDLKRRHRHHEEVLHRAVLALVDEGGARQDDRQHRDRVHQVADRLRPHRRQVGVVAVAGLQADEILRRHLLSREVPPDFAREDRPHRARARVGDGHLGGVDVELDGRLAPRKDVPLHVERQHQHERVLALIQHAVRLVGRNQDRLLEVRRQEGIADAAREHGVVLVDNRDRDVVDRVLRGRCGVLDAQREAVGDQEKHQRIPKKSDQLLESEFPDVLECAHHLFLSCLRKSSVPATVRTGSVKSSTLKLPRSSAKPSPLQKTPREMSSMCVVG